MHGTHGGFFGGGGLRRGENEVAPIIDPVVTSVEKRQET